MRTCYSRGSRFIRPHLVVDPLSFHAGNTFPDTETYEFEDSKDTLWKGNDGSGCLDGDSDFASGSTPPPKC